MTLVIMSQQYLMFKHKLLLLFEKKANLNKTFLSPTLFLKKKRINSKYIATNKTNPQCCYVENVNYLTSGDMK